MIAQPFIDEKHRIPLDMAIKRSTPGQDAAVSRLYKACLGLFRNEDTSTGNGLLKSRHVTKNKGSELVLAVVTDEASGLFVQLGGIVNEKDTNKMLLTYGKKFIMEMQPPQLQNTAIKVWS